jgi:long-chain acyl-CoA synthetase
MVSSASANIAQSFARRAEDCPDRMAIVSPRLTLTFGELLDRTARSACELSKRGVEAGANIGIALRDGGEAAAQMLSLWMLGAIPVPIDFRTKPVERARLINEFDLVAILEDRQVSPQQRQCNSIIVDEAWTDIIAKHNGKPVFTSSRQAPAVIALTSGTTGRPVGIMIGHEQLLLRFSLNLQAGHRRNGGRFLNPFPISSSSPRNHTFTRLLDGAAVYFHSPLFSPGELAEAVLSKEITHLCVVPTILRGLLDLAGSREKPLLKQLDSLHCFGAPTLPEEKLRAKAFLSEHFIEGLSSTLTGRISLLGGDDIDARPETVGRVLPHVEIEIVDDADEPLPAGTPGIIRVRSPLMAQAIYGAPSRESGDKLKDGWAYPGDVGALDRHGFLRLFGRNSDLIIRGGSNVHPSEIENVIAEHETVREVAVVGYPALPQGEEIAAFVVPRAELNEAALIAHCRRHLAPDKRPRRFIFLPVLPRNANGKILHADLRRRLQESDQ